MKRKDKRTLEKTITYINSLDITAKEKENRIAKITKILEISDINTRYSILYDEICDYIDNEYKKYDFCKFCNGICEKRRKVIRKNTPIYPNGCCFSPIHGENCKYLKENGCSIRNLSCKLFLCNYIRKTNKFRFSLNDIYLSKYTFNLRQKFYLSSTFFVDKDVLLDGILKRK